MDRDSCQLHQSSLEYTGSDSRRAEVGEKLVIGLEYNLGLEMEPSTHNCINLQ